MKHILILINVFACCLMSCARIDEPSISTTLDDIRSLEYDKRVNDFAKALNKAVAENIDFRNLIKTEVLKQFDGDYDILLSMAFDKTVKPSDVFITKSGCNSDISVKEMLSYYYVDTYSPTKSSLVSLDELVDDYPELQISMPVHAEEWDSNSYIPDIAFIPSDYEEFVTETVPGIDSEGNEIQIDAINAPEVPVMVVGLSERIVSPKIVVGPPSTLSRIFLSGEFSNDAIRLTYMTTNITSVNSIKLYRTGANNSIYTQIPLAFAINNTFIDWDVIINKEYSYYIVAECTNSSGSETLTSNILTLRTDSTAPKPVSNLSVTSHYGTKNYLSWSNPSQNNFKTQIFKTTPDAETTNKLIATLSPSQTYYYDEPTVAGEKWFYYVNKINPNTNEVSSHQQTFIYNPYRNPSGKSKVMLKKIHVIRDEVEGWLDGKPEFYVTTYGYEKTDSGELKIDTLSTIDQKFANNQNDSQALNGLMADWSFFDDSQYYPVLNINLREYDRATISVEVTATAKIGKKLKNDISVVAKGAFSYKFANQNADCGTVILRYYENPEQTLTFPNYGASIVISEQDDNN